MSSERNSEYSRREAFPFFAILLTGVFVMPFMSPQKNNNTVGDPIPTPPANPEIHTPSIKQTDNLQPTPESIPKPNL